MDVLAFEFGLGVAPDSQEEALSKLNTALTRARKALEAKQKGNIKEALEWWHLLFNKKFTHLFSIF